MTLALSVGVDDLPLWEGTTEAEQARLDAIRRVHEHANAVWKETAYAALLTCARRYAVFTSDLVWAELKGSKPATHNLSALGPLFLIAARKGLIRKTGRMVPTTLTQRHRDLTEWASLVLDEQGAARAS